MRWEERRDNEDKKKKQLVAQPRQRIFLSGIY